MFFLIYSHKTQARIWDLLLWCQNRAQPQHLGNWTEGYMKKKKRESKREAWASLGKQESHSNLKALCRIMWITARETKTQIRNFVLFQRRAVPFSLIKCALPILQASTIASKKLWADRLLIDSGNTSQAVKSHIYISESNLLSFPHEINSVAIE